VRLRLQLDVQVLYKNLSLLVLSLTNAANLPH